MELLQPSYPPLHAHSSESLSGFSSPASFRHESDRATTSHLPEIVEDCGNKVYVAVGKSVEKGLSLLNWSFRRFPSKEICLLHVHQPSQLIPTLLGKLPASQANAEVVYAHRNEEREQTIKLLQIYSNLCSAAKVKASIVTVEADQVHKGIVELVNIHNIRKLVMGAVPENCMKMKKNSSKANYAAKNAPLYCEIWFINKGKHLWTRDAFEVTNSPASYKQSDIVTTENSSSRSFQYGKNKLIDLDFLRSSSEISSRIQYRSVRAELILSPSLSCSTTSTRFFELHGSFSPRSVSTGSRYNYAKRRVSISYLNVDEERLYNQLIGANIEAGASRNEALADMLKVRKLEKDVMEAISKVRLT